MFVSKKRLIILLSMQMLFCSPAFAIKKCKDANGQWHYGDLAAKKCDTKKGVTTLTDRGFVDKKEQEKTKEQKLEEELLAKQKQDEENLLRQEEEERVRILSVYETEEDIDRQRDNQLSTVDTNILMYNTYIERMSYQVEKIDEELKTARGSRKARLEKEHLQAKDVIVDSKGEIKRLEAQKAEISERFAKEKETFRVLKQAQTQ